MSAIASAEGLKRDSVIISLVGLGHFTSHLLQLALPPLFPILHREFGIGYTELGLVMTCFYGASGLGQATAGVLVDRYGAYRLLAIGVLLESLGIALIGFASAYWVLLPLAILAGLGNSVFHPSDLSILSHRVTERRLGRAFAIHGLSGQIGFAVAPVVIAGITAAANWRAALIAFGVFGVASAALIYGNRGLLAYESHTATRPSSGASRRVRYLELIGTPVVMLAFGYFVLTAFGGAGVQTFSITALTAGYGLALSAATFSLTLYLIGNACGMAIGGFLADCTQRHSRVAMGGMAAAAALMLLMIWIGSMPLPVMLAMAGAGIANGITAPSRDVLIRRTALGAGMGSVFGFVYSGFDLGASAAPLLFGALLDHHAPHAVFLVAALGFGLAAPTVMQVRQRRSRPVRVPSAAD